MKYRVLLHKSEEGYFAVCPKFPVCNSRGSTAEDALENVRYVLQDFLTEREEMRWDDVLGSDEIKAVDVEVEPRQEAVMRYPIRMIKDSEGYAVSCPMLPGCFSAGSTMEEALANIQIAIREWLISIQEVLLLGEPDIEIIEVGDEDDGDEVYL